VGPPKTELGRSSPPPLTLLFSAQHPDSRHLPVPFASENIGCFCYVSGICFLLQTKTCPEAGLVRDLCDLLLLVCVWLPASMIHTRGILPLFPWQSFATHNNFGYVTSTNGSLHCKHLCISIQVVVVTTVAAGVLA